MLAGALLCFAIEFYGMLRCLSLRAHGASVLQICAHAAGAVSIAFFILDAWPATSFWSLYVFTKCVRSAPWHARARVCM